MNSIVFFPLINLHTMQKQVFWNFSTFHKIFLNWNITFTKVFVGSWTFASVRGPERSGAGFHQGSLCTLLRTSFPRFWLVSQSLLAEKHPHSMMLPPPCFTVGMAAGFLQTWCLAFRLNSYILVSSDQRILFLVVWESFRCLLANSKWAVSRAVAVTNFRQLVIVKQITLCLTVIDR